MTEPLKPEEVVDAKKDFLPDEVIEVFNALISEHWNGSHSKFEQKEIIERIKKKLSVEDICGLGYLDVEDIFEAVGWKVIYDKPAATETYEPTFEFRKKL